MTFSMAPCTTHLQRRTFSMLDARWQTHCYCLQRLSYKQHRKQHNSSCDTGLALTSRLQHGRRSCKATAALTENPQNVPDPQVLPRRGMSAKEAVEAQLNALQQNDTPWGNHGIQTMYEFGETIGGLDRCYYFGYGKDLYHFDHFMGNFQNVYPELVNLEHYSIQGNKHEDGVHKVLVEVTPPNHTGQKPQFVFILAEKDIGAKQGALMTSAAEPLGRHNWIFNTCSAMPLHGYGTLKSAAAEQEL